MLDITKVQSTNTVCITGLLTELDIEEKTTADGRKYVRGSAIIRTEQERDGAIVTDEIPVGMFSMRLKADGTENRIYDNILSMKESFTSLAAAETPEKASRVTIDSGKLEEHLYLDRTKKVKTCDFQITSNFMNRAARDAEDCASFELSGVVANIKDEVDKEGEETGRLIVQLTVVGYRGKVDVINLIASSPAAANHIRNNWEQGETINLSGSVCINKKTIEWEEEQGFGTPIKRHKTVVQRELIIERGSKSGLDEEFSYDGDAIKLALDERFARINQFTEKAMKATKPAPTKKLSDVGF